MSGTAQASITGAPTTGPLLERESRKGTSLMLDSPVAALATQGFANCVCRDEDGERPCASAGTVTYDRQTACNMLWCAKMERSVSPDTADICSMQS